MIDMMMNDESGSARERRALARQGSRPPVELIEVAHLGLTRLSVASALPGTSCRSQIST